MGERLSFLADEMLGSLARWLRMMGYDTEYVQDTNDSNLLQKARTERRCLLTRDRQLAQRAGDRGLLVLNDSLNKQLEQVVDHYDLEARAVTDRCTLCNGELMVVAREDIGERVPPLAKEINDVFFVCKQCGQIYWRGSHWRSIERQLRALPSHSLY